MLERSAGFERIGVGRDPEEIACIKLLQCGGRRSAGTGAAGSRRRPPGQHLPGHARDGASPSISPMSPCGIFPVARRSASESTHLLGLALCTRLPTTPRPKRCRARRAAAVGQWMKLVCAPPSPRRSWFDWDGARLRTRSRGGALARRMPRPTASDLGRIEARGDAARVTVMSVTPPPRGWETRHRVYRARMTVELARGADRRFRIIRAPRGRFAHYADEDADLIPRPAEHLGRAPPRTRRRFGRPSPASANICPARSPRPSGG